MKTIWILYLAAPLLGAASCKKAERAPAEPAPLDRVCTDPRYDPVIVDGKEHKKRVIVEGYLASQEGMYFTCTDTCDLRLLPTKEDAPGGLSVSFKRGSGANRMERLPDKYSTADIKLHAHDGKVLGVGSRIRVTATKFNVNCNLVYVERVEAL